MLAFLLGRAFRGLVRIISIVLVGLGLVLLSARADNSSGLLHSLFRANRLNSNDTPAEVREQPNNGSFTTRGQGRAGGSAPLSRETAFSGTSATAGSTQVTREAPARVPSAQVQTDPTDQTAQAETNTQADPTSPGLTQSESTQLDPAETRPAQPPPPSRARPINGLW